MGSLGDRGHKAIFDDSLKRSATHGLKYFTVYKCELFGCARQLQELFNGTTCIDAAALDVAANRREYLFKLPQWVAEMMISNLRDARDVHVATLYFNVIAVVFPAVVILYMAPACHLYGAVYLGCLYGLFLARFLVALLHVTEHRPLFKTGNNVFHFVTVFLLAPLFGVPSGMYPLHHRIMHHVEGNERRWDLSSTEQYQRDSILHFLWYWVRHASAAWIELLFYALRKRRLGVLLKSAAAQTMWIVSVSVLWKWKPVQTLWAFVLPYIITSIALMFGNWSQHIFIDPRSNGSAYGMAYNCVACGDNASTFNDGYHIQHHLNSMTHWSDLPLRFMESLDEHAAQAGLAFAGLSVFEVGLAVFMGRLDVLVDHLLICGGKLAQMSRSELIHLLKDRLKPLQ